MDSYSKNKIPFPTIGRVVYFFRDNSPHHNAAIVADVIGGHTINLAVINHDGSWGAFTEVPHKDDTKPHMPHWDWMPYQKGQAAKTEALQDELDRRAQGVQDRASIQPRNNPEERSDG